MQGNVFYNMFQLETLVNIMLLKYVEPNFLYLCTIGTAVLKLKHHLVLLHCTEGSRQYQPNLKLKCWPNPQQASVQGSVIVSDVLQMATTHGDDEI